MDVKPGYTTSEFWATVGTQVLGALMASGVIASGSVWEQIAGAAITLVASMGYGYFRTQAKTKPLPQPE